MDIDSLMYFSSAYSLKSISKAANELNISQQGLSKSIKTLEAEINAILFTRKRSGIEPTVYGEILYKYTKLILGNYEDMKSEFELVKTEKVGFIKIGIAHAVMSALKLELPLTYFLSEYPGIKLETQSKTESECERLIADGSLDFAFMMGPFRNNRIHKELLFSEDINAIMRKDNPLAKKNELTMVDLVGEPLICSDKLSRGYERLMEWYNENHQQPKIVFTSNEPSAYQHLVKKMIGIALCPSHYLKYIDDDELVAVPLSGYEKREVFMCYNSNRELALVENILIQHINNYYNYMLD